MKLKKKVILLAGPTASGKSKLAIQLAKKLNGEIINDSKARLIRDGSIIYNGKINTIFREKNQAKQVSEGLECGITLKDFNDFQKKDIIEVFNSLTTERTI